MGFKELEKEKIEDKMKQLRERGLDWLLEGVTPEIVRGQLDWEWGLDVGRERWEYEE